MGKTYQSVVINAPVEKVWGALRNFHDLSWASGVVTSCTPVGDLNADQVGARRIINDAFHETLVELSEVDRTLKYSIDDGPLPVSKNEVKNYIEVVHAIPITDDDTTFVEWSSSWDQNDAAVYEFCHGIYCAVLGELKKTFS
jgi:hypothetical protein